MRKLFKLLFKEHFLLLFMIILFSAQSASFVIGSKFLLILFLLYTLSLYFKKFKSLDRFLIIFILIWGCINIVSLLVFKNVTEDTLFTFFHVTTYPFIAYLILKIMGPSFFTKMEKIIFTLTLISLPIFIYQLINTDFFYSLSPLLNQYSMEEQQIEGGWYIGIYMFSGWAEDRNSGFMWEPGAFAFMIILAIYFRLSQNKYKFDKYIFVYILAVISTFSLMGYLAIFFIILFFISRQKNIIVYVYIVPLFLFLTIYSIIELDFLGEKLIEYFESTETIGRTGEIAGGHLRMTRFGILIFALEEVLYWPLGFGIFQDTASVLKYGERATGPNTYAQILFRWGFLGIILFFFASWNYIKLAFSGISKFGKILLFLSFATSVFSYSHLNSIMFYVILFTPFIFNKNHYQSVLLK